MFTLLLLCLGARLLLVISPAVRRLDAARLRGRDALHGGSSQQWPRVVRMLERDIAELSPAGAGGVLLMACAATLLRGWASPSPRARRWCNGSGRVRATARVAARVTRYGHGCADRTGGARSPRPWA
ncbi:hypothetical protein ACU4GD_29360 [Cupriavidus basilensis]